VLSVSRRASPRHDEGLDTQADDDHAVDRAGGGARCQRGQHRDRHVQARTHVGLPACEHHRRDGGGERQCAADAEIDSSAEDYQRHAKRDDADFRGLAKDVGKVADFQKNPRARCVLRTDENRQHQDHHQAQHALKALQHLPLALIHGNDSSC